MPLETAIPGKSPMLELYHHGSSVCAAKVRLCLEEKGLEWRGHYIDTLKGEQFDPAYKKLNPKQVVPTLVHDGRVVRESTLICEYLERQDLASGTASDQCRWPHRLHGESKCGKGTGAGVTI